MHKQAFKWASSLCVMVGMFIFGALFIVSKTGAIENETNIVIYHTNDLHGHVGSVWSDETLKRIGLDIIKSIKSSTPNSILIDSGDATWGTFLSKYSKGQDIIKLMNAAEYDGMTLGNHEFDYGVDSVLELAKMAQFPIVSANTFRNGKRLLENINKGNGRSFIIEIAGKRIGFFGITTEETNRTTIPDNLEGIEFKNELEISQEEVKELKAQKVDIIVAIMHVGVEKSGKITSRDIAKKVSGIDIILDGHSHTEIVEKVNNTVIIQTGIGGANLGKIEIKFVNNTLSINAKLLSAEELGYAYSPDRAVRKMYDEIYEKIAPSLEKVVGRIGNNLYGGTYNSINISRLCETSMGDLICDAMMYRGREILKNSDIKDLPVVAFENGGAVRAKIGAGFIKMEDIYNIFPLDNRLSVQVITPKTLYRVLERGVGKLAISRPYESQFINAFGGFPQVAGITIEVDPTLEPYDYERHSGGRRVTKVVLLDENGKPSDQLYREDDKTQIAFLFNDYALYEYPAIKDTEIKIKDDYLYNILSDYTLKLTYENNFKFSYPLSQNRVTVNTKSFNKYTYESEVTLKDSSGALSSIAVNVSIDDKHNQTMLSNDNGAIKISDLTSGPHVIKIRYGNIVGEVYVNNEIGIKNNICEFTDPSEDEISSVSDIIGQIPYNVTFESRSIIQFARQSYESLTDSQKERIFNYYKLQKSEEKLRILDGETPDSDVAPSYGDKMLFTFILLSICLSGTAIIWMLKNNEEVKN